MGNRTRRSLVVVVVGVGIGALTSFLQTHLRSPWFSLANSATPWLVAAFVLGTRCRRFVGAAAVGAIVTLLELFGYTVTASLRGFPSGWAISIFWAVCAVVGGPLFGVAGRLWWTERRNLSALGAAVIAGAFIAEGTESYALRLHYLSSAVLFWVLGIVTVLVLGVRRNQLRPTIVWMAITVPVGFLAELALGLVYRQAA